MASGEDELIRRAVGGALPPLAALLEDHGPRIAAGLDIAPKWRSMVSSDDVMQVTYLEAFLRIGDFVPAGTGGGPFAAWLRRIAENNLRDAVKELSRAKRPQPDRRATGGGCDDRSYVDLVEVLAGPGGTPSGAVAVREAVAAVEDALAALPPDYEQVLRLFELRGQSIREVADVMGRSEGSIKMLLTRARDRLRESLGSASRFFSRGS